MKTKGRSLFKGVNYWTQTEKQRRKILRATVKAPQPAENDTEDAAYITWSEIQRLMNAGLLEFEERRARPLDELVNVLMVAFVKKMLTARVNQKMTRKWDLI